MKRLLILLLVFSFSFCLNFGNSEIEISREWHISGIPADNPEIDFTGMLVANTSNQKVLRIYAEPPLTIHSEGDEVFVSYTGPADDGITFNARAVVLVDYDTDIENDEPLSKEPINGSYLVMWNEDITELSDTLAFPGSTLKTMESVLAWLNDNLEYDLAYYGLSKSAQDVIIEKRGVCVEYTHLFVSMMNSLGVETRYAGGYVMADEWQPHSWAEVYVDGQWIAVDPTFNEAGILDTSHVVLSYGNDSSDLYDKVITYGDSFLASSTEIDVINEHEDSKGINVELFFNNETDTLIVEIENTRDEYFFGTYERAVPEGYGGQERKVVLLEPGENYRESVVFPQDLLMPGFSYTIPARASFNDASDMENVLILKEKTGDDSGTCIPAIILSIILIGIFLSQIIKNK